MGAVDLVVQVSSPGSVASGLQRVGRAGHSVGTPSRGRIYPRFRGELVEAAAVARGMLEGEVEHTRVPRIPLDVLCQQIVAMASVEELQSTSCTRSSGAPIPTASSRASSSRTCSTCSPGAIRRTSSPSCARASCGSARRASLRAREGAQRIAIANAGTIPDRGLYGVFLVDGGGRVGELDEEMVHEAREGQVFLLGASAWRIEQIERDRVIVSPAPGQPRRCRSGRASRPGRPLELGRAVGRLQRELAALDDESAVQRLMGLHACDERAARTLVEYLREQELATGVLPVRPDDRRRALPRRDRRLAALHPLAVRRQGARALGARAARAAARAARHRDARAVVGRRDHPPPPRRGLAAARRAGRDRPRSHRGSRRRRARRLVAVRRALPRERCARTADPAPAPRSAHAALAAAAARAVAAGRGRALRLVPDPARDLPRAARRPLRPRLRCASCWPACGTAAASSSPSSRRRASPFAASLNFEYVAQYLYEDDAPAAERRVAALTLDRDLLRELPVGRAARPARRRRARAGRARARQASAAAAPDALHDLLRRVGDLAEAELADAPAGRRRPRPWPTCSADRRAVRLRIGGEDRLIAAEDIGRYRDALGTMPPGGMPAAFLEPVPDALRVARGALRALARAVPDAALAERYDLEPASPSASSRRSSARGRSCTARCAPAGAAASGATSRCCAASAAHPSRACAARSRPSSSPRWRASRWPGTAPGARAAVASIACARCSSRCSACRSRPRSGSARSCRCAWTTAPSCSTSSARAARSCGWAPTPGASRSRSARTPRCSGRPRAGAAARRPRRRGRARARCRRAPPRELCAETGLPEAEVVEALWRLVASGEATNDAWEPLRRDAPGGGSAHARAARRHAPADAPAARRRAARRSAAGRRPRRCWRPRSRRPTGGARSRSCCSSATACSCAPPSSPRAFPAGPAGLRRALGELETLGVSRRGYLVDGLGGAQHALPGAIERLREVRDPAADAPRHRAGRERSGESLRHRPALAGARGRPCLARGGRARSSCATASRSRSSSAEPARCSPCSRSSPATGPRSPKPSRRPRSKAARARCSSSASTARPRPLRRSCARSRPPDSSPGPKRLTLRARR